MMWHVLSFLCAFLTAVSAVCSDGWQNYVTSCYRVFDAHTTFNAADRRCSSHQGHLLTVKSEEENDFVTTLIKGFESNQFWFGIFFNRTGGYWMDDGSLVTWSLWVGHGTDVRPTCALMVEAISWTSNDCTLSYPYICEITLSNRDFSNSSSTQSTMLNTSASPINYTKVTPTTIPSTTKPESATLKSTFTTHTTTQNSSTTSSTFKKPISDISSDTTTTDGTTNTVVASTKPTTITQTASWTTKIPITLTTTIKEMQMMIIVRKKNPGKTYIDNRPSAVGIGGFGAGVLICVLLGVFLLDASKLAKDFKMLAKNMSHFSKSLKKRLFAKRLKPVECQTI